MSQTIRGLVIDKATGKSLVYVNIGVVETTMGTISNLEGEFSLSINNSEENSIVRFSMIGYHSQEFKIKELLGKEVEIKLSENPVLLDVVIIKPNRTVKRRLGTKNSAILMVTGWYGVGKGYENGIKIKVSRPVYLETLHFHIASNTCDSVLLRMHIRNIVDNVPSEELLNENILIPASIKSGWVHVDLTSYDLSYNQDFALTLEWLKAWGENTSNFLLSMSIFKGTIYSKVASEANWTIWKNKSPGMYLDVLESK